MAVTQIGALPLGWNQPISIPITATGVTNYATFQPQGSPTGRDHTLVMTTTGATALPTTLTVDFEISPDGGTTWNKHTTGIALVATTVATQKTITGIPTGLLLRLNPTTYTAGSSTGATVYGSFN